MTRNVHARSVFLRLLRPSMLPVVMAAAVVAPAARSSAPAGSAVAKRVATIDAAWQRKRGEAFENSPLTPFTVAGAFYIDDGKTGRVGADGTDLVLDPKTPMKAMAAISYQKERFWISPVEGAEPPRIHETNAEGDPLPRSRAVSAREEIKEGAVGGVGRFFFDLSPQSGYGRIMVYDPNSPARKAFHGFPWFPVDPNYRVAARWIPNPKPDQITVSTTRGLEKTFYRAGKFEFTVDGTKQSLVALSETPAPNPGESFFIPFRDATCGKESYDVGRYLQGVRFLGKGREHFLDFNRATNPFCAYSAHYNCPVPPKENDLSVAIRAGEKAYPHH